MGSGASNASKDPLFTESPQASAMKKFLQITNGDEWINCQGWKEADDNFDWEEPDFKTYFGLGVNKYADIIRIKLVRNKLRGRLPAEEKWVRTMAQLRTVDLGNNKVAGPFPPTWCLLTHLTLLDLSKNEMRGTFPDAIGNLVALNRLKLGENQFHGKLPQTMSKLTNLVRLELHRNKLTHIPDMLGNLMKLHTLKVNENCFTGEIPQSWVLLESIRELYIYGNEFVIFDPDPHAVDWLGNRALTKSNLQVLDILRKRCHILVMTEDQVGDGGFVADRLPTKEVWPNQPHLYGNGFPSVKLKSHTAPVFLRLKEVRSEEREVNVLD
jgi:hypothetical protein